MNMGLRHKPFAFTELGVAMLSSVLNSKTAIEVNMSIMRAFVTIRQSIISQPTNSLSNLQSDVEQLKSYLDEIFSDQNDINEDTRTQIELINQTLAEMRTDKFLIAKP
jgi:peptidoglycan hydrolase CwlO-like protein